MGYKFKKLKLNTKLILSLVSIIVLVVVSIAVFINSVFEKKFEQYIIKNNEKEISALINSIESEYNDGKWNLRGVEKIGKNAIDDGIFIDLYDINGNLVWGAMKYNQDRCNAVMGSIEDNMNHRMNNWSGKYTERSLSLKGSKSESIGNIKIGSYGSLYYMDNDIDIYRLNDNNKFNVNMNRDGYIVTKYKYDKFFNIYIDNNKVSYYKVNNDLVGIKVNKGKHIVEVKYFYYYKLISFIVSMISIIVYKYLYKKNINL